MIDFLLTYYADILLAYSLVGGVVIGWFIHVAMSWSHNAGYKLLGFNRDTFGLIMAWFIHIPIWPYVLYRNIKGDF